ncbi:hypothetical protein Calkro_0668 [Caldicellulosiruptor kronotskyensis 2002]|uniref:Type II secretion system F domain n=1 Tax=Caldicellulosiruptor kronotskyensis (strain DSM 18902 / VKM B-2412 / 2002) TaxID=632348 RepID=E4SES4_CALK2|nr:hypothetical protein [Caldicellulosiruptor kronotskyensis]ADQ45561.1 hypothetical protein Calkro_0668 [Caldicellulosiruptor kronotskyensis 2002]
MLIQKYFPLAIQVIVLAIMSMVLYNIIAEKKIASLIDTRNKPKSFDYQNLALPLTVIFAVGGFLFARLVRAEGLVAQVLLAVGFGIVGHELPKEYEKAQKNKLRSSISDIALMCELGLKAGLSLDRIFTVIAETIVEPRYKDAFLQTAATYKTTHDVEECFLILKGELEIRELEILKRALLEVEKVGLSGIQSLEVFAQVETMNKIEQIYKKSDKARTYTTYAMVAMVFALISIYFFPLFKLATDTLNQILGK